MNYKVMVITAKIAKFYYDKNIPIEVGYQFLSNDYQVEFRLSFTKNGSLINCYQAVALEFIDGREPDEVAESLLAGFETVYEEEMLYSTKLQTQSSHR